MQGIKHKLNTGIYKSSRDDHYPTAIVSYKTARYFCESFNHEKILFTYMLMIACSGMALILT